MEGVSSRLGRASSRYGNSSVATAVFSGPVRKWKKEWVHVSSSSTVKSRHTHSQSNGSRLLLRRWTPTPRDSDAASPPRRKFRYTPIAVLEEQKKVIAKAADDEMNLDMPEQSTVTPTSASKERKTGDFFEGDFKETKIGQQNASIGNLDLGLCLKGHNNNHDSFGKTERVI